MLQEEPGLSGLRADKGHIRADKGHIRADKGHIRAFNATVY